MAEDGGSGQADESPEEQAGCEVGVVGGDVGDQVPEQEARSFEAHLRPGRSEQAELGDGEPVLGRPVGRRGNGAAEQGHGVAEVGNVVVLLGATHEQAPELLRLGGGPRGPAVIAERRAVDHEPEPGDDHVAVLVAFDLHSVGLVEGTLSGTGVEVAARPGKADLERVGQQVGRPLCNGDPLIEQERARSGHDRPHCCWRQKRWMAADQRRRRFALGRREVLVDELPEVHAERGEVDDAATEVLGAAGEVAGGHHVGGVIGRRSDPAEPGRGIGAIVR